jgi:outer membrane cobalamin receptor
MRNCVPDVHMRGNRGLAGGIMIGFFTAGSLMAQTPEEGADTLRVVPIDPVVVSVTHLELLRSRVPNSVSVVTRRDLVERGAPSVLTVASERVPGLFVSQRGVLGYGVAQGAAGRVSIRGAGASPNTQVLVMTDGRPQTMGLFGHPIADTHVSSGVERVEVVRGPASLLYGTNAMGGVVNVITRKGWRPGPAVEAAASYGSFATQRQEVAFDYGISSGAGISVAGNRYRTDGHRPSASFAIDNVTVRGGMRVGPGLHLVADGAVSDILAYDPGRIGAPLTDNWVDIRRGTTGVALENHGDRISGAARAFLNFGRHDIHDGFHSTDRTFGLQLHQGIRFDGGGALTLGADVKGYGGEAENTGSSMDWGSHSVEEYGAFGVLHQPLPTGLVATGGIRVNHHSLYGAELVPQAGLAAPILAGTTLRVSSGRGFRSPTIRELYLFPAPTPELEPERVWSHELSVIQTLAEVGSLEMAVFRMDGSNLIRTAGSFPNLTLSNSGEFRHSGAEVALQLSPLRWAGLDLSYGYLDSGESTLAHPEHQLQATVRVERGLLNATLGAQHVAGLFAADGSTERLPDYTVVNSRLGARLPGGVTLFVAGENLFDTDYQVMGGYPMPGRVISVGAHARPR